MSIADNLHRVQERIARAAESAARGANEVTLVGVTKYVGPQQAAELAAAGCTNLGESRPQELWKKHAELITPPPNDPPDGMVPSATIRPALAPAPPLPIHWHLIGHLQRNK